MALNLVLAVGAAWAGGTLARRLVPGTASAWVIDVASILVAALVAVGVFIAFQPLVSAPFVDALTERTEILVRGGHPRVGFFRAALDSLWHGGLKTALYLVGLGLTLALSLLTGVGGLAGAALTALFLAFDGFDYPLARREVGFASKWGFLARNPGLTVGYAAGATLLYLVPLAILVAPSFAAVGATLAFLDAEGEESDEAGAPETPTAGTPRPRPRPDPPPTVGAA
jgi:uncharacterized protein involved in cysteine biosynthesis